MMPLTFADEREEKEIVRLAGTKEVRQHLADLGFSVGSKITVVSKIGQNMIVKVKGASIALSKELANKIMV
ncbi:MAG: ferrous iron transport protein A [Lachnospiraceae bacterium]|nr:ferrous iron transport protein A [Lachnospiraceae bacterium]